MKCQACSGNVSEFKANTFPTLDQRGVCQSCGAVYVAHYRTILATAWCTCKDVQPGQEIFYFSDNGNHGWMHAVCGQITQTG